jgi:hypothetical protein
VTSELLVRFGLASDIHYADRDTVDTRYYRHGLQKLNVAVPQWQAEQVAFCLVNGDAIDHYGSTAAQAATDLMAVKAAFGALESHFVMGNHEQDKLTKAQIFATTGQSSGHYSFDRGGVHFVILDANYRSDNDADQYEPGNYAWNVNFIPPAQRTWLVDDLAAASTPVVVFCHYRLDDAGDYSVSNRAAVRAILEASGKVRAVFQGHNHLNALSRINGVSYLTLAAMTDNPFPSSAFSTVSVYSSGRVVVQGIDRQWRINL